jgi:hypothetical protein
MGGGRRRCSALLAFDVIAIELVKGRELYGRDWGVVISLLQHQTHFSTVPYCRIALLYTPICN